MRLLRARRSFVLVQPIGAAEMSARPGAATRTARFAAGAG